VTEAHEGGRDGERARLGKGVLGLIFALALVLRVGTAIDYAHHHPQASRPAIDEESYEDWAREIAAGDWIGDEVFFQEPLYPYWLGTIYRVWGIGDEPAAQLRRQRTAARHIQALYGAAAAVLIALAAARIFGRRAGIVAGIAFATYKPLLLLPALLLKPNLVVPLICLLPLLSARLRARAGPAWMWGLWGVMAGLGALLRGNLLLLLPAFVALPLLTLRPLRRGALAGLMVTVGIASVLLPVAARNQAVGGVLALTTSGAGTNVYGGNNPENPFGVAREFSWVRGIPAHEADDWRHEAERRTGRLMDPGEVSSFWLGETLASMRRDPLLHARIFWNKLRLSLGAYEVPDNHDLRWDARYVSALRVPLGGFGVWGVLGLAGMGAFALRRRFGERDEGVRDARGAWELAGFFALYLATIVLTVTSMRIRLALVPALLPFAGYLVDLVLRRARPLAWAPALVVAAAIVHVPAYPAAERAEDLFERDYNLATDLLSRGRLDDAAELVERLTAEHGTAWSVRLLRADLGYRRGAAAHAAGAPTADVEREYAEVLALLKPIATSATGPVRDRFRAQKLAGLVAFDSFQWAVAERRFREALAFDPDDVDVRLLLARSLWNQAPGLSGPARRAAIDEAGALLSDLADEFESPEFDALRAEIDAASGG